MTFSRLHPWPFRGERPFRLVIPILPVDVAPQGDLGLVEEEYCPLVINYYSTLTGARTACSRLAHPSSLFFPFHKCAQVEHCLSSHLNDWTTPVWTVVPPELLSGDFLSKDNYWSVMSAFKSLSPV